MQFDYLAGFKNLIGAEMSAAIAAVTLAGLLRTWQNLVVKGNF